MARRTSAPQLIMAPGLAGFDVRSGRALTGEALGVVVNDRARQATMSATLATVSDITTACELLRTTAGLPQVAFATLTLSAAWGDTAAVTLAAPAQKRYDHADLISTIEMSASEFVDQFDDEPSAELLDAAAVTKRAGQVLGIENPSTFPPRITSLKVSDKLARIDEGVFASFEITVDDETRALGEVVDIIEQMDTASTTTLVYRPSAGQDQGQGRFAASTTIYAATEDDLRHQTAVLLSNCSPVTRLRIRRSLYRHDEMALLAGCCGVAPWQNIPILTSRNDGRKAA